MNSRVLILKWLYLLRKGSVGIELDNYDRMLNKIWSIDEDDIDIINQSLKKLGITEQEVIEYNALGDIKWNMKFPNMFVTTIT